MALRVEIIKPMQQHLEYEFDNLHWYHLSVKTSLVKPQWLPQGFKHETPVLLASLARYRKRVKEFSDEYATSMCRVGMVDFP